MLFNKAALAATALTAALLAAPIAPASAAPAGMTANMAGVMAGFGTSDVTSVQYRRGRWRGHRGHRRHRRGYRRHRDGFWYPLAAFGALAAGAAIAGSAQGGSRHVRWCEDRYRSYDRDSDTFQPYNGPRKRCNSPYR
jgi:hypothetical protein